MRQVILLALAFSGLSDVNRPVEDMFLIYFVKRNHLLSFINTGRYIQLMVSSPQESRPVDDGADEGKSKVSLLSPSFGFLVFFHALCFLNTHKEYVNVKVSCKNGMQVAFVIQKVHKV